MSARKPNLFMMCCFVGFDFEGMMRVGYGSVASKGNTLFSLFFFSLVTWLLLSCDFAATFLLLSRDLAATFLLLSRDLAATFLLLSCDLPAACYFLAT